MKKISALINYCNDIALLRLLDESGQLDVYDEILLVDGPYFYVNKHPFLGFKTPYLDEDPWGKLFIESRNVIYIRRIWSDEEEKRAAAYEACTNDLIILHDTDEFYDFDYTELEKFSTSECGVGFFRCQNLCLDGYYAAAEMAEGEESFPLKAFAFNKKLINSKEHLDYLWLVGVKQNKKDHSLMHIAPLAKGYHFTQMRDEPGQVQKFSFYTSLYASTQSDQNKTPPIIELLASLVEKGVLTYGEAQSIYLRGNSGFAGMMRHENGFFVQKRISFSEKLEKICVEVNKNRYRFVSNKSYKFINGWPCFFFVKNEVTRLDIQSESVLGFSLRRTIVPFNIPTSPSQLCMPIEPGKYKFDFNENAAGQLFELIYRSNKDILMDNFLVDANVTFG